jgi:RNA polymerase sigma factor (sigma-70 family)
MRLHDPDPDLFAAARSGDAEALEELIDPWIPVVLAWCKRLGGSSVDAQDATQDVLVLVTDRIHQVWSHDRFRSWLFGVTRRVLAHHRRNGWWKRWFGDPASREVHDGVALDDSRGPDRLTERSETAQRVELALQSLSEHHREVLVLCDLEDRTDEEAAELLAVPVGTVKSRLRRAREGFRAAAIRRGLGPEIDRVVGRAS